MKRNVNKKPLFEQLELNSKIKVLITLTYTQIAY